MDLNSDEVFLSEKLHQTSRSMPNAARAACSRRSSNLAARGAAPLCCCSCLWNRDREGVWSLLNNVFCWQQTSKIKCVLLFFQLFPTWLQAPPIGPLEPRLLRVTSGSRMLPSSSSAAGGLTRTGSVTLWSEDVQAAESLH